MPEHTPREIVEQCKLRWQVSLDDLIDHNNELDPVDFADLSFDEQAAIGVEMEQLIQHVVAAECILDEFDKEGV